MPLSSPLNAADSSINFTVAKLTYSAATAAVISFCGATENNYSVPTKAVSR